MKKNNALISVVVPVYKVEKYLERCVNSILSQTYRYFELILVDDGSPDCCGKLCDDYANKDKRVKVIHKKNGGLSDARNVGTQESTGAYITYIDSDDWVSPYYLESLYNSLVDNKADMSVCRLIKLNKEKNISNLKNNILFFSKESALSDMLYQKNISNSACGKLISRELMNKYLFPIGKIYEDLFTTYKVIAECNSIVLVNSFLYYYRINSESIMHQSFSPKMFDEIDAVDEIELFVRNKFPSIVSAALSRKFSSYCQVYRWMCKDSSDPAYDKIKNMLWSFIISYRSKMFFDKKSRLKNRFAALISFMGATFFGRFLQ